MDHGLIYRRPKRHQWVMGQGKASRKLGADAADINPTGDWKQYDSKKEHQRRNGFETMNCTNFATYLALIALAAFKKYTDFPDNCSERYSGVCTLTSPEGNEPWWVAESIATRFGAIHENRLPWTKEDTWQEYYAPYPMDESLIAEGQKVLRAYEIEPEWVFHEGMHLTPAQKRQKLQEALRRGTVCVAVRAWDKVGDVYVKPKGSLDNHWVWLPRYEDESPLIRDQYPPFYKKLDNDYDFSRAIIYFMRPNPSKALPHEIAYLKWLLRTGQPGQVMKWIKRNIGL